MNRRQRSKRRYLEVWPDKSTTRWGKGWKARRAGHKHVRTAISTALRRWRKAVRDDIRAQWDAIPTGFHHETVIYLDRIPEPKHRWWDFCE